MKLKLRLPFTLKSDSTPTLIPIGLNTSFTFKTGSIVDTKTIHGQYNSYLNCPPVPILITAKATAANHAYWFFGKEDGTESTNQSIKLYRDLFKRPNEYQSWGRFFSEAYQTMLLFGRCYIHVKVPTGMQRRYATSLEVIKNINATEVIDQSTGRLIKLTVTDQLGTYDVPYDELMIWNDFTISYNSFIKPQLGQSRLYSLSNPINTIIAAYQANNKILTNYGMLGIISPDGATGGVPNFMTPKEKEQIQDDMQNDYGLMNDQWPLAFMTKPMQYTNIMRPVKDLDLHNTIKDSTVLIAEAMRYPPHLLGITEQSTYNNIREASKDMYSKGVIPEVESFMQTFNRFFNIEENNKLRVSFDHIQEMQADEKYKAEIDKIETDRIASMYKDGLISLFEAQDLLKRNYLV